MGWHEELETLARERGSALTGYAYTLCGDVRQAEDLVQEALVRYCSRLVKPRAVRGGQGSGDPRMRTVPLDGSGLSEPPARVERIEAFVRRTILNLYLDGWRRKKRWTALEPRIADPVDVRFPDSGITARADVVQALNELTPRQRSAVVLRYFEDMTISQVAETLGTAPGTVKRYLHDSMRVLRGVLEPTTSAAEGGHR
ncbi:sigma-70 family RNA polymerase sigma factor [Myceligenerans pegani]|uniref:Sigma-70 family RNA polymerase sigma factor n=1 Tax=Myceligenerans pegani TaxID=2776917 RepID=A0ABR9N2T2_9MICO|nr:sigma-70 family RNA polymerase sigma factor [Myceligenerans sp. TRM 65318]MBE1877951.1 sigma-70 family RNA polymerase sigma factor [Myceligenerans sp. TRM 65318]MBE3020222.1 sigma-70 family RNA polymerase sigma factor [Myceligenerans sp. TRM 65318]